MATLDELLNPATAPTGQTLADLVGLRNQPVEEPTPVGLRTFGGTIKDIGVTAAKSVVGAGESLVGLANIPTLGMAGKALESVGYAPEKTHEILDAQYSPAQQQANKEVADAKGFVGTVKAAVENPSTIGHTALESAAPMLLGGGIGGKLIKAGVGAATAGALGEGIVAGGGVAESIRQQTDDGTLSPLQAATAVGAGAGTTVFGVVGARLSKKFGLGDVDEYLAKVGSGVEGAAKQPKNIISRIIGGGISEGVFEELPQSVQETVWQNAALGKPLLENVPESAAQGLVAGAAMGAGFNALPSKSKPESEASQTKDHVATEMLKKAFPGAEISVSGGKATIVRGEGDNVQAINADVADIGKMLAAGADLGEMASSQEPAVQQQDDAIDAEWRNVPAAELPNMDDPDNALAFFEQSIPKEDQAAMADVFDNIRQNNLHKGMTFPQQLFNMVGGVYESRTGKKLDILGGVNEADTEPAPKFAKLEDGPDTLRYNIRGKDYAYAPLEGQTVDDLRTGVEGKSPAAAVNWLKKNSQLVKEVPNVQTDQVVPEPVVPQAEEIIAPVARGDEADAGGVQGEPVPVTDEAPKLSIGVKTKGQRPSKVKAEIEKKYGALDKVIASGKLNILRATDGMPEGVAAGSEIYSADGKTVVGAYVDGKVYLVADAIAPGEAPGVFLHEVAHRLLDQDTAFKSAKAKIVTDFGKLDTQAAKDARGKVPATTPAAVVGEEGLAYFLQTQEGRKSSLWRRLVVAVRSGLRRLGFSMQYTEDDILEMFTAGARSFVQTEEAVPAGVPAGVPADVPTPMFSLSNPGKIASTANDALSESRKKVGEALLALSSPRAKGRELYEKYAPQWLSVTSLHHVAQVFGKAVPQIKSMDRHMDTIVATKTTLTDNAYDITLAAEKATAEKGGAGIDAFDDAGFVGTFNQMTPWKGKYEQDWMPAEGTDESRARQAGFLWVNAGMKKATGLTFHEAYHESVVAFNKLSPDEQKHLKAMVADTAAVRQRDRTNMLKSIEELSEGNPDLRAALMMQFNATFNNLRGMYLPLSRFGDFILEFTDTKGFRTVEYFDTPADRKDFRNNVVSEGVQEATMVEKRRDKNSAVGTGIPQELMVQLTKSVEVKFLSGVDQADESAVELAREQAQSAVSDMNQAFFRWLPQTSALKNSVRRKNIKGASRNMIRSYNDYVQRHAVSIAWTEVGRKIEQDIMSLANDNAEMRKAGLEGEGPVNLDMRTNLLNDMKARVQAIRDVKDNKFWATASKINTGMFMTSPSAFFVQMTQLPVLTLPKLGTMFGWGKSAKAMATAGGEAFSKKFSAEAMRSDPDVNAVYKAINETVTEENRKPGQTLGDLVLSESQRDAKVKDLAEMKDGAYKLKLLTLREAMDRNLLDISAVHEARERAQGGDPNSKWSRLFRAAMLPMQHGELASRKTAVLATLDLALKSGKGLFGKQNQDGTYAPGAIDDIHEVVKGTLFSYAKEDMGAATQGGAIRTILQFQKFRVFTGLRIARLFLESVKGIPSAERAAARKEFVGIMGMSTLIGGVKGTIYAAPIMAIANLLFGWDDDDKPYSAELDFTNWMEETFGKTAGDAIAHGPLTLMGTNISRRVGLGDIYGSQAEPPPGLHGAALASWWAGSLLGPTFSVAQGWFKGYDQMMNKGNYMRGLEDASPKPVKDALKAFRFATEGVKTGDGRKILSDDEIGVDELLTTFFGFQSDEVARAQAANAELGKMSTAISERRGRLIRDAAEAILSEDGDIEGAIAAVTKHAQKMPQYAITASEIKGAIAKRIKGEFGVTGKRDIGVVQDYDIDVLGGGE